MQLMNGNIPKSHPRYFSLLTREKISQGLKNGLVHETGLIAHGRGEAFDYLLGEKTIPIAEEAERIAAAVLLKAENPVISVNGNVVALVPEECVRLAVAIPAKLEVNLFHRSVERIERLAKVLRDHGAQTVYGLHADMRIPGLPHDRGICEKQGIYDADVVLVPLEDGDRCQALRGMEKFVVTIDLNPLSRTARTANVTIVDNIIRAMGNIEQWVNRLKGVGKPQLEKMVNSWDNEAMLREVLQYISKRLNYLV